MNAHREVGRRRRAFWLGLLAFAFMCAISVVAYFQDDDVGTVDLLLLLGGPIGFATIAHFVGLHHEPDTTG